MRKVFRDKQNADYWEDRWAKSGVDADGFENENIYPIRYAKKAIKGGEKILEAGCGAGRVYFHFQKLGFDIKGIEYSKNAVKNILKKDEKAKVIEGSITDLKYENNSFDTVLAFGLFHNLENKEDLQNAFDETKRVLNEGGLLVASVRFDSLENKIIENIVKKRANGNFFNKFHRWHFSLDDMRNFLRDDMKIEKVYYARNVSWLFKFDLFRTNALKTSNFSESKARSGGFELNLFGRLLDKLLHGLLPKHFSNLLVIIARKRLK